MHLKPSDLAVQEAETAACRCLSRVSWRSSSVATWISRIWPIPRFQFSSSPTSSPLACSCANFRARLMFSVSALTQASSFSIACRISSAWELPISQAFFPNSSKSWRFVFLPDRNVLEMYAFRSAWCFASSLLSLAGSSGASYRDRSTPPWRG